MPIKSILTNRAFCRHVTTSSGRLFGVADVAGRSEGAIARRDAPIARPGM
jgi:hypothetical protein